MGYRKAYINGLGVQDLDPTLTITGIEESAPELEIQTSPNAKYDGTHVTGMHRRSLEIIVKLWCKERRMDRRARILDRIREWADDGQLRVNYRPHQLLEVIRTGLPAFGGEWKTAEEVELKFTAYGVPYWQEEQLTGVYLDAAATAATLGIRPPGTAEECFLRWDLANQGSGNLTGLKLAANGTFIELTGLSIPVGGHVIADYDLNGYLSIKDGDGVSLLPKRTAASFDDVILRQRSGNEVTITANVPVSGKITARGLYL